MNEFLGDLWDSQRALMLSGSAFLVLFIALAAISAFDDQQILGVNRWIKPMKFAISIAIFLWTTAIYLYYVRGFDAFKFIIAWGTIITMIAEIVIIVVQAARGTTSHFNVSNGFDGALFGIMGLSIAANTLMVIGLLIVYFFAEINLPQPVVWGMRFGIILFLAASVEGGYMISLMSHSVGVADGGEGLPLVNWSTKGGDLRVAHFIGLHAMQIVPFVALILVRLQNRYATTVTVIFAVAYFAVFTLIFLQALRGQPVISTSKTIGESNHKLVVSNILHLTRESYDE